MPIPGADTDLHGIRLDVYLDEAASEQSADTQQEIFDIEPDHNNKMKDSLPKRVRFYHSMIDRRSLEAGIDFSHLRNVWVILIMDYDPIGDDRVWYTIRNSIVENPDISYDDGARTVLLYTHGNKGIISEDLRQHLAYMEDSSQANVVNPSLSELDQIVNNVKLDREVNEKYMKSWEWEQAIRADEQQRAQKEIENERQRAEQLEMELAKLKDEIKVLKSQLRKTS